MRIIINGDCSNIADQLYFYSSLKVTTEMIVLQTKINGTPVERSHLEKDA